MLKDAIKEYQADLGVDIATARIKEFLKQADSENPKLNIFTDEEKEDLGISVKEELKENLAKVIERYL